MCCASTATSTAPPPAVPAAWGPFDVVASRYGVQCQGCDELALTLLDVLDYMEEIPVVAHYKLSDGTVTDVFPMGKTLDDAQPVLETLPGWHCDITAVRKFEDLPEAARNYVTYIEKAVGCKIKYISVGSRARGLHRPVISPCRFCRMPGWSGHTPADS